MIKFTLAVNVYCSKCHAKSFQRILSDTVNTSWERKFMLNDLRQKGWQFNYGLRKGLTGDVLCPDCAKKEPPISQ